MRRYGNRLLLATVIVMAATVVWAVALFQHLQVYNREISVHREVLTDFYGSGVVYAAYKYEQDTMPTEWYTPEELGIAEVWELKGRTVQIVVDREKEPFPFGPLGTDDQRTIFLYKDEFCTVSHRWVTFGLREPWWTWGNGPVLRGMGIILIVAWIALVAAWQKTLKSSSEDFH